jgi:hypothetical protein
MTARAAFRGQPLLLLGGVIAGWMVLRVATWEVPFAALAPEPHLVSSVAPIPTNGPANLPAMREQGGDPILRPLARLPESGPPGGILQRPVLPFTLPQPSPYPSPASALDPPRVAIGHNVMFALGLSQMPLPAAFAAYLQGPALQPGRAENRPSLAEVQSRPAPAFVSRWSADGWLLLRRDGAQGPVLSDRPSYGRSQAGAVVRYALAPTSALRPQAYLRGAAALAGAREREAAAGVSLRPVPGAPVRVAAEARVSETGARTRLRPAAFAVTELPPFDLPLGLRGEAYLQAGYVGGEFATAFADGQARVERPLTRVGEAEVSAGAGAWGGAQKDSARLDIGPTAAVTFRLGEGRGRLSADYRFRVAGDAEPESGPAVTLSAGF